MDDDLLAQIGKLVEAFDRRFGCETSATLLIHKEGGAPSKVTIEPAFRYRPQWGRSVHPLLRPPDPGQTRLTFGSGQRLSYKK